MGANTRVAVQLGAEEEARAPFKRGYTTPQLTRHGQLEAEDPRRIAFEAAARQRTE